MKITSKTNEDFSPVTLSITFETKDELDKFGTLFNVTAVAEALPEGVAALIYREVVAQGGDISHVNELLCKISRHSSVTCR